MEPGLFAAALGLVFIIILLYVRRLTVERALVGAIETATLRVKGRAGERNQSMGFRGHQILELTNKRSEMARIRRKASNIAAEIALRETIDYRILHMHGEPTKGKATFKAILTPNPLAEKGQVLSSLLHKVEHVAMVVADNDTMAKRILAAQYPDKGPLRIHSVMQATSAGGRA